MVWRTLAVLAALSWACAASADEVEGAALAQEDRIAELERTVAVLASELERTRSQLAVPEEPELKSFYGLGPAASKVYQNQRGISIGGYGEGLYTAYVGDQGTRKNSVDWLRTVLYVGYRFTENLVFNAEFEFEHATTEETESAGGGSVSVEFAALDFFWRDELNARAGLLLLPMGFLNEVHEPPYYFGTHRPEVERRIIPTTWRENGAGIFGSLLEGDVQYRAYVLNGMNAAGFRASGLRDGRQDGNRAFAEQPGVTARIDWYPLDEWLVGGSFYWGNSGQNQVLPLAAGGPPVVPIPDTSTTLFELHSQYERYGLFLRGLFSMAFLDQPGALTTALRATGDLGATESISGKMLGAYGEIAYDVWQHLFPASEMSLWPFFRYEYVDTQLDVPTGFLVDPSQRNLILTAGLSFKPIPQIVLKMDYRNVDSIGGGASPADEVNLGIGFAF